MALFASLWGLRANQAFGFIRNVMSAQVDKRPRSWRLTRCAFVFHFRAFATGSIGLLDVRTLLRVRRIRAGVVMAEASSEMLPVVRLPLLRNSCRRQFLDAPRPAARDGSGKGSRSSSVGGTTQITK